ncbi:MAG TPA: sulfatase [Thermoanaerobaculia bacterium]|nr:sulfatase [Thermoanaerobaculia bacterium]
MGTFLGLIAGLADAVLIAANVGNGGGMTYTPPLAWIGVIWTSVTLGTVTGLLFGSPRLGRFRGMLIGIVVAGVLVLARGMAPLREITLWHTPLLAIVCLIGTTVVSIPLLFIPVQDIRRGTAWRWTAMAAVSAIALIVAGLDPQLPRWSPNAAPPDAPNVALIFLDTVRHDDALGNPPSMPSLERFSKTAIDFENAWAPAPWTVPSHLAVLTGKNPWSPDAATTTLAERLQSRHFDTAAVSANPLLGRPAFFPGYSAFTYSKAAGVCRSAFAYLLTRSAAYGGPRIPFCAWFTASEVTSRALDFVQRARRPYFLTVNYMDAHYPYYVPRECHDFDASLTRQEREAFHHFNAAAPPSSALIGHVHREYRATLACIDRSLAKLLAGLDDQHTVIVIAGDHGEQFGEHGLIEHGNSVYRQVLHVPLVIKLPHTPASRVTSAVSLTDLYATIVEATAPDRRSTLTIFDAQKRRPAVASYDAWTSTGHSSGVSAVDGGFHYIGWADGREAIFNDALDPAETSPLPSPRAAELAGRLRALTQREVTRHKAINEFRALGYIQ